MESGDQRGEHPAWWRPGAAEPVLAQRDERGVVHQHERGAVGRRHGLQRMTARRVEKRAIERIADRQHVKQRHAERDRQEPAPAKGSCEAGRHGARNTEQGRAGERRQARGNGPIGQAKSTGAKPNPSASDLRGLCVLL
jgi:hypothetical protein